MRFGSVWGFMRAYYLLRPGAGGRRFAVDGAARGWFAGRRAMNASPFNSHGAGGNGRPQGAQGDHPDGDGGAAVVAAGRIGDGALTNGAGVSDLPYAGSVQKRTDEQLL